VSALFLLFAAESFVFAAMWRNKSPRSEREHESEKPDPAVLFSRRSTNVRGKASKQTTNQRFNDMSTSPKQTCQRICCDAFDREIINPAATRSTR